MEEGVANNVETTKKLGGITGKGFMPGVSGNPSGRPKGGMKNYLGRKFSAMTDEELEGFIKEYRLTGKDMIEFGEGKAKQDLDIQGEIVSKVIKLDIE